MQTCSLRRQKVINEMCVSVVACATTAAIGIFSGSCGARTRDLRYLVVLLALPLALAAIYPTELRSLVCVQTSKLRNTVFLVRLYAVGRMKASTMEKFHKPS